LLAVTITKDNRYAAPFIDLVNHFYGRPNIPIGAVRDGKTPEDSAMLRVPVEQKDAQGHFLYPRKLSPGTPAREAVSLLEEILAAQPDQSVRIAQIGFSTNLSRLVASPTGLRLAQRKVKALYLMAGNFVEPKREYNVYSDAPAFDRLMREWPSPIIFSGYEIGLALPFPYHAIANDFQYVAHHPIAEAYHLYMRKQEDRPNWDSTAVLEAIRPNAGYFALSQPGRVTLGPKEATVFTPDPQGHCRYLILKPDQIKPVRALITSLVSERP
jgi:inosine-uridine nucleoside N-ribohydrolase